MFLGAAKAIICFFLKTEKQGLPVELKYLQKYLYYGLSKPKKILFKKKITFDTRILKVALILK